MGESTDTNKYVLCLYKRLNKFVPVQFTNGSQPADVAPAARQDGQMVGVQCQEETLGGELRF